MNKKYQLLSTILENSEHDPLPQDPEKRKEEIAKRRRMMMRATGAALAIGVPITAAELISHGRKSGTGFKGVWPAMKKIRQGFKKTPIKAVSPFAIAAGSELAAEPIVQHVSNKLEDRYQKKLKAKQTPKS